MQQNNGLLCCLRFFWGVFGVLAWRCSDTYQLCADADNACTGKLEEVYHREWWSISRANCFKRLQQVKLFQTIRPHLNTKHLIGRERIKHAFKNAKSCLGCRCQPYSVERCQRFRFVWCTCTRVASGGTSSSASIIATCKHENIQTQLQLSQLQTLAVSLLADRF